MPSFFYFCKKNFSNPAEMNIFIYDKSFEGLLTCVFDAYFRKTFPDRLLKKNEPLPLFYEEAVEVCTASEKSARVWKSLEKKLSSAALSNLTLCWLSELPGIDERMFRYIRKTIDAPVSVELNFGDEDVLEIARISRKVRFERTRMLQFIRFQKAVDGTYFAAIEPDYNVLPLAVNHFKDRFADQKWLLYDLKRKTGFYYDLKKVSEVSFETREAHLISGMLDESLMVKDEKLFQRLWKTYFKSVAIKERINPVKQRKDMPVRYWKYLTEKQR